MRPVLTSMTVSASVCSMISDPPTQPDLAVEALLELFGDLEPFEQREVLGLEVVVLHPIGRRRRDGRDVVVHLGVQPGLVDDDRPVLLVELLTDHADRHVGLAVQERRPVLLGGQRRDLVPLLEQPGHVTFDFLARHVLGGGPHDHAVVGGLHAVEDLAEPLAFLVRQPLGDAVGLGVGDEDHESTGEGDLLGQPGALVPDGVLGHLAEDQLLRLEDVLDAGIGLDLEIVGVEVDVAAVQHRVLGCRDVDERRFHAGEHVLDPTEIDVAVDLADVVGRARHVVLDERPALRTACGCAPPSRRARSSGARPPGRCAAGPAA